MNKGGYQILDLNGTLFADSEFFTIDGSFKKIADTRKPVLITNFVLEGSDNYKMRDVFVLFTLETDDETSERYYKGYFDLPIAEGMAPPCIIKVYQSDKVKIIFF